MCFVVLSVLATLREAVLFPFRKVTSGLWITRKNIYFSSVPRNSWTYRYTHAPQPKTRCTPPQSSCYHFATKRRLSNIKLQVRGYNLSASPRIPKASFPICCYLLLYLVFRALAPGNGRGRWFKSNRAYHKIKGLWLMPWPLFSFCYRFITTFPKNGICRLTKRRSAYFH